jgi:hypothetical protein
VVAPEEELPEDASSDLPSPPTAHDSPTHVGLLTAGLFSKTLGNANNSKITITIAPTTSCVECSFIHLSVILTIFIHASGCYIQRASHPFCIKYYLIYVLHFYIPWDILSSVADMNPLIVGGAVIVVLLLVWAYSRKSNVVPTPAGGATMAGSPAVTVPVPTDGVPASVAVATPEPAGMGFVKRIRIIKDTSSQNDDPRGDSGWRSFQVAEVFAYTNERKLTADDYSDATLSNMYGVGYEGPKAIDGNPATFVHTSTGEKSGVLTLTLKNEMKIIRVEVLNRQDCCQERLAGAKLVLEDPRGNIIWSGPLTGARDVQMFPINL